MEGNIRYLEKFLRCIECFEPCRIKVNEEKPNQVNIFCPCSSGKTKIYSLETFLEKNVCHFCREQPVLYLCLGDNYRHYNCDKCLDNDSIISYYDKIYELPKKEIKCSICKNALPLYFFKDHFGEFCKLCAEKKLYKPKSLEENFKEIRFDSLDASEDIKAIVKKIEKIVNSFIAKLLESFNNFKKKNENLEKLVNRLKFSYVEMKEKKIYDYIEIENILDYCFTKKITINDNMTYEELIRFLEKETIIDFEKSKDEKNKREANKKISEVVDPDKIDVIEEKDIIYSACLLKNCLLYSVKGEGLKAFDITKKQYYKFQTDKECMFISDLSEPSGGRFATFSKEELWMYEKSNLHVQYRQKFGEGAQFQKLLLLKDNEYASYSYKKKTIDIFKEKGNKLEKTGEKLPKNGEDEDASCFVNGALLIKEKEKDKDILVVSYSNNVVSFFNTTTKEEMGVIEDCPSYFNSLAYSYERKTLYIGSYGAVYSVSLVDSIEKPSKRSIEIKNSNISSIIVFEDYLILGDTNNRLFISEFLYSTECFQPRDECNSIREIIGSRDGKFFVFDDKGKISIRTLKTKETTSETTKKSGKNIMFSTPSVYKRE